MNGVVQMLRGLGGARLAVMAGIAAALFAFFIYLSTRLGSPDLALLYDDLDLTDSGQIVAKLEGMGVSYELRGDGSQILVPRSQALRLRMTMAQEGLPAGGNIGYEIFDRSTSFGTTNFVQKINHLRALEGELARTIRSLDQVAAARVHLVLPQRELFSRAEREPSASIVLKMRGGARLSRPQVRAIQHLAAAAVPNLKPDRISIIDDSGNLLAGGAGGGTAEEQTSAMLLEMRQTHENRLRQAIETLLERSVGLGNVRAEISAEMDLDRLTTSTETYDPDGQVARSTQVVEEASTSAESDGGEAVTVAGNLPDAQADDQAGLASRSNTSRTEETTNYEISKTLSTRIYESGTVKRLSVAVLVDGTYTVAEDGAKSYVARSEEALKQLSALVRLAVGYDETRGDKVEVINMRFAEPEMVPVAEEEAALLGLATADLFRIAEIVVLGVVAVLVLLLVVRPLVARAMTMAPPAQLALQGGSAGGQQTAIAAPESAAGSALAAPQAAAPSPDSLIDLAQVEGQVRESSISKVSELVDKHPEETVAIMRQWLYQEV